MKHNPVMRNEENPFHEYLARHAEALQRGDKSTSLPCGALKEEIPEYVARWMDAIDDLTDPWVQKVRLTELIEWLLDARSKDPIELALEELERMGLVESVQNAT